MSASPIQHARRDVELGAAGRAVNIAERLTSAAQRTPNKAAVIVDRAGRGGEQATFSSLESDAARLAAGFQQLGIRRGARTIVMIRPGVDFFATTFALFKLGAVPVLIDPGMGRGNLVRCLAGVDAEAFIGIPLAHVMRVLYRTQFSRVKTCVTVGRRWFWSGARLADLRQANAGEFSATRTSPEDAAAILFTSGSTGPAKGVLYTHGIFDAQVEYLRSHYGYSADEIDLATFPLFALFDAALGMTAVIPEMDASRPASADPRKLVRAIRTHRCTHMFGSPALVRNLARYGEESGERLATIKRVLTAGAPIPPELLISMKRMLPADAEIHTPYGATEALPVSDMRATQIDSATAARTAHGGGTCVGRPLPGMDVRVIEIDDNPIERWRDAVELPPGRIGEVVVSGPVVTAEYFRNLDATRLAKIIADDGAVRHRMGDVGYFDEQGRLWYCGRKSQRVVTQSEVLFTIPCEAVFNEHPRVRRTALVGVGMRGKQTPILCVEMENDARTTDRSRIRRELLEIAGRFEHTRSIRTVNFVTRFPVDVRHNAKIFREKLTVQAAKRSR